MMQALFWIATLSLSDPSISVGFLDRRRLVYEDLSRLSGWSSVFSRHMLKEEECARQNSDYCANRSWKTLLVHTKSLGEYQKLSVINRKVNERPYVSDSLNWGKNDYWADIYEFFKKGGDCEDFATAKYILLRKLGWKAEDLEILVVRDMNLKQYHAILIARLNGIEYVLDSQISFLVKAERIKHYNPVYGANERRWWFYLPKK